MPQPKPEEQDEEETPPPPLGAKPPRLETTLNPWGCFFSEPQRGHSQGSLRSEMERRISNCSWQSRQVYSYMGMENASNPFCQPGLGMEQTGSGDSLFTLLFGSLFLFLGHFLFELLPILAQHLVEGHLGPRTDDGVHHFVAIEKDDRRNGADA